MSGDSDRIAIEQLRYVRLGTKDLTAAADFAQRILGLQLIDQAGEQIISPRFIALAHVPGGGPARRQG